MIRSVTTSLREQKKATTRRKLIDVGEELFRTQGFEKTTLEQISNEAGVSIRTVLRYFGSKDQLALDWYQQAFERFREGLRSPHRKVDVLSYWREYVAESARQQENAHFRERLQLVQDVPLLKAYALAINREYEDLLAEALTEDFGGGADAELPARLFACMLIWGNAAASRTWNESGGDSDLEARCVEVVDFARQMRLMTDFPQVTRGISAH